MQIIHQNRSLSENKAVNKAIAMMIESQPSQLATVKHGLNGICEKIKQMKFASSSSQ